MANITGYPDFTRLQDQETARQLKLVWDALLALSADFKGITVPDVGPVQADLLKLTKIVSRMGQGQLPHARLWKSTNTSVASGGAVTLPFDTVIYDVGGLYSAASPTRITITKSGLWIFGFNHLWAQATLTWVQSTVLKNGSIVLDSRRFPNDAATTPYVSDSGAGEDRLIAGDYLECSVSQENAVAAARTVLASANRSSVFWASFVGE